MSESLLSVIAHIHAKPGKEEELREALLALVAPTRVEDGCVQYDLHVSTESPGKFVFYENWTSKAHLDTHLATPHLKAFGDRRGDLVDEMQILTFTRIA